MKAVIITCAMGVGLLVGGGPALAGDINCFAAKSDQCHEFGPHALPKTKAEFTALQRGLMEVPDQRMRAVGAVALFVYASMVRSYDDTLGTALIVEALDASARDSTGKAWSKANEYYVSRLYERPFLVGSYAVGADPAKKYAIQRDAPIRLRFRLQTKYVEDPTKGTTKIFLCTPGANTCRPVKVVRDAKGVWRVGAFSSITIGF